MMLALIAVGLGLQGKSLWVSESGNDRNSGLSRELPLRSIERAIAVWKKGPGAICLSGTFRLSKPLVLDSSLSSVLLVPDVDLISPSVNHVTLTTAAPVTGWRNDTYNGLRVWSAAAPAGLQPHEMFVGPNAERMDRPRLPEQGFYRFTGLTNGAMSGPWNQGQSEALFKEGDIPPSKNLQDVEVVAHHYWVTSRLPIASIEDGQHLVRFQKKSVFRLTDDYTGQAAPYYLDNVGEALQKPGQWYWDRGTRRIYYVPRARDSLKTFTAEVPRPGPVVIIKGAESVQMDSIEIRGAEWNLPKDSSGDMQGAISVPGAVQLEDAHHCRIFGCKIHASGTYGIEVKGNSSENIFTACTLLDLGGGGVKIGHGTSGTTVNSCQIKNDGIVYPSAVGVWIGDSGHNKVRDNEISGQAYTGVSVGWTWGYGPSQAVANEIEGNYIHDIGQGLLSDMGGIYTLGVSPGTVIAYNKISRVNARGYGGWGIYLDEGSTGISVHGNVVSDCKTGSFHQHYGKDNRIYNNVFAFAKQDGQIIRSRAEDHNSFTFERNIVVWKGTPLFGGDLKGPGFVFRNNLLWMVDGKPSLPAFVDSSNVVADPLFRDAANGDYRLKRGSPAVKVGFDISDSLR